MTDAEWAVVREALPVPAWLEGRRGQPEGCHRQMLDAIRYVTDNGIKRRAMPCDFPAWDRVYDYFRRWREAGLAKEFHDRLRARTQEAEGRHAEPTAAIIDSQSVKGAASVPACSRGYDGGKKINGRRRHVITDSLGLLLMVLVCAADITDRQAAPVMPPRLPARFARISLVWADGGYYGRLVDWAKEKLQPTLQIVKRSDGNPRAITRRSNTASASASSARTRSASARSSSARARAARSRSSTNPITDVTAQLRIAETELIVRTLPQRHRNHA
ncbi:IS5 family transposase [Streptomyces sp. NBC_00287]|uniref:IS5 family transposase n=1 Tax=Streptomyces sp. NBC_00287 TaxID=2975702 RepID=UPI002E291FF7|nr:IS5 family transposase [Streptomyces sp. NBC_00287]